MARSVLIIEDDHNIADLLRLYLEKDGYEVRIAADGLKGMEAFRKEKPDLILLDVMLPGMDGWAVCRAIRAESAKTERVNEAMAFTRAYLEKRGVPCACFPAFCRQAQARASVHRQGCGRAGSQAP